MSTDAAAVRCTRCGREIEACAVCEEPGCPDPCCYADLILFVGQSLPQPHRHNR